MIINDEFGFVFVHIPKCAGTSIRSALAAFDDRNSYYYARRPCARLGELDFSHIPLKTLATHFKQDFACIQSYRGFAVVRDPFARFPSSLTQRLLTAKGIPIDRLSPAELERQAGEVIAYLRGLPADGPVTDPDFIHFCRQADYLELDGERLIESLFPIERQEDLLAAVAALTKQELEPLTHKNETLHYKIGLLKTIDRAAQTTLRALLPERTWTSVSQSAKSLLIASGLLDREPQFKNELMNLEYVHDFIREFYSRDLEIYHQVSSPPARASGQGHG